MGAIAGRHGKGANRNHALTNIAFFDIVRTGLTPAEVLGKAKAAGLIINTAGGTRLRALTHYDVTRSECETAASVLRSVLGSARA